MQSPLLLLLLLLLCDFFLTTIFYYYLRKNNKMSSFRIKKVDLPDETPRNAFTNVLPSHPARVFFSGSSGSGKTNLILNLLLHERFQLKKFFKRIFLFCPTAKNDPSFKKLKGLIKDEDFFVNPDEADIQRLVTAQDTIIKQSGKKISFPLLFVFDDCITNNLLKSSVFLNLFFKGRHLNISTWVSLQYFNELPKSSRQNITNFMLFKPFRAEIKVICEELCPGNLNLKKFARLIDFATTPRDDDRFPFLHIDKTKPFDQMFRRNLTRLIQVHEEEEQDENPFK